MEAAEKKKTQTLQKTFLNCLSFYVIGIFISLIIFSSFTEEDEMKGMFCISIDILILIRIFIARYRKEQGVVWVFYSLLPILLTPIVELSAYFYKNVFP